MKTLTLALCILGGVFSVSSAAQPTATSLSFSVRSITDGTVVTNVPAGTAVVLQAVLSAGSAPSKGEVRFCDVSVQASCAGTAIVGKAEIQANGKAIVAVRLSAKAHTLKAIFSGTNDLLASVSSEVSLQVGNDSSGELQLVQTGGQGNYTLTATYRNPHPPTPVTGPVEFQDTTYSNHVLANANLVQTDSTYNSAFAPVLIGGTIGTVAADFNNDGLPDFVRPSADNTHLVFSGNTGTNNFEYIGNANPLPNDFFISYAVSGDFNRDGSLDLVVAIPQDGTTSGYVVFYAGNGDGTFQPGSVIAGIVGNSGIAVGDFDGDGFLDVISGDLLVTKIAYGNGDGTFASPIVVPGVSGAYPVADFNGDGRSDFIVSGNRVMLGNADRTFTASAASSYLPGARSVADVNHDGKLDLIFTDESSTPYRVGFCLGNGDGTFQAPTYLPLGIRTDYFSALLKGGYAADVDGDGKLDLIAVFNVANTRPDAIMNNFHVVFVMYPGNGDGTYQAAKTFDLSYGNSDSVYGFTGDFDGDGAADVVVLDGYAGMQRISFLNTFTATAASVSPTEPGSHVVQARYAGDAFHNELLSNTVTLTGGSSAASLALFSSQPVIGYGQSVTLTATLANWNAAGSNTNGRLITFYKNLVPVGTAPLSSGNASLMLSDLEPGTYSFTASYPGDPTQGANTSSSVSVIVDKISTFVHWSDPASIFYGTALSSTQLNARAQREDGQEVAGTFAYSPAAGAVLNTGTQTLSVHFTPTDSAHYREADQSVSLEVLPGAGTTVSFTGPSTISPGVSASFTVHVTAPNAVPTGTVTLFENTQTYGSATLDASGSAVISHTFTAVGAHVLQVAYSGDSNYQSAISAMQVVNVQGLQPTITWNNPAAITYNAPLTATQLNATASGQGGVALAGTFTYSPALGTVLTPGAQTLSVTFTPSDTAYSPVTKSVSIVVYKAAILVSLNAITASSSVGAGANVVLHATAYSAAGLPTGSVKFFDSTTLLGTVMLDGGAASLTTSFSTVGSHSLTAVYDGDPYFLGGTSPGLVMNVVAPHLQLTASPTSFTVHQGASGFSTITLTPTGGYKGTIHFNCDGLPALASCNFAPASITLNGDDAPQSTLLTVTTAGPNAAMLAGHSSGLAFAWLLGLPLAVAASLRKGGRRLGGSIGLVCLLMLFVLPSTGCGVADSVTPAGNANIQVVAQASAAAGASGGASQSITLNITIAR